MRNKTNWYNPCAFGNPLAGTNLTSGQVVSGSAADAYIYLNEALGGGWEPYQHIPRIRHPEPAVIAAFHRLLVRDDPQK